MITYPCPSVRIFPFNVFRPTDTSNINVDLTAFTSFSRLFYLIFASFVYLPISSLNVAKSISKEQFQPNLA